MPERSVGPHHGPPAFSFAAPVTSIRYSYNGGRHSSLPPSVCSALATTTAPATAAVPAPVLVSTTADVAGLLCRFRGSVGASARAGIYGSVHLVVIGIERATYSNCHFPLGFSKQRSTQMHGEEMTPGSSRSPRCRDEHQQWCRARQGLTREVLPP